MFADGVTFYCSHKDPHLWIIISDPSQDPDNIVQVNLTTLRENLGPNDPRNDRSCVLAAGDHSTVDHATIVYYNGVQITSADHLAFRHKKGELRFSDPVTLELLVRMRAGAAKSDHITPFAVEILEHQGLL